jgi:RHS repeat-associated protein
MPQSGMPDFPQTKNNNLAPSPAYGAGGGSSAGIAYSTQPGSRRPHFNVPFVNRLTYDRSPNVGSPFGANLLSFDLASISFDGTGTIITYRRGANSVEYFQQVPGSQLYKGIFYSRSYIIVDGGTTGSILYEPDGRRKFFDSGGRLYKFTDPYFVDITVAGSYQPVVAEVHYTSGGDLEKVTMQRGADTLEYSYHYTGAMVDSVALKMTGRWVRRTRYTYDSSDRLLTYAVDESTTPTGTDGGWAEIDTTFYTYHSTSDSSNGLLKHVVGPNTYKQMKAVNSSWPQSASDGDLDLYADKKYVSYDSGYRVASLATKGGRYTYSYQYTFSSFSPGSDFNIWTSKTVVTQPDGSGHILYFNKASQLMLRQVVDNVTSPTISTSFSYTFHDASNGTTTVPTFQIKTVTVTLPAVPTTENGTNTTHTVIKEYDQLGYLSKVTSTRGIVTTYEYDKVRGGLTKMVEDVGTGTALNLTTDYEIDDLGREVLSKGPPHFIDISGASVEIRAARWTYYKDAAGEVWNFGGYIKVSDSSVRAVGPVSIYRNYQTPSDTTNMQGWRQASWIDVPFTSTGIPAKTATFAQNTWLRWSCSFFDKAGELMQSRLYWTIPSSGDGTVSTNYGKTLFGYDSAGRTVKVTQPGGTIVKAAYNAMGWLLQTSIGTNDSATTPPNNMLMVQENQYDGGGQGVGNLTQVTLKPTSSSGSDRITTYRYDWRLRLEETEATVEADGGGTNTLITKRAYDNRGNVTSLSEFKTNTSSGNRIGYRQFFFDTRNRPYQTKVYAVNSSGTYSTPQTSKTYYGSCGRVLREEPAGSATFTVTTYDSVSRLDKSYIGYVPFGTSQPITPTDISTSIIMEQSENAYDAASNLISTLTRSRHDDTTGTGGLQASSAPLGRASYQAFYPDSLGRQQAASAYGTGVPSPRPSTIQPRSDTILINSTTYDSAGNAALTTDPQGTLTSFTYDKADRLVGQVENAPASSSSSSSSSGSVPSYRTTGYEYTDDSLLKKLKCDDSSTGQQITVWTYGVTTGQGSAINSNLLVYQKTYPDSSSSTDLVTYKYNRLGQATEIKDQAGTVHLYAYDKFGRFLSDLATLAAGSSLDNTIGKIDVGYEVRGMRARVTSSGPAGYAASSSSSSSSSGAISKVNEVKWDYNDFRQPVTEYQEVAGAVNTSTSRKLQYAYASGSANTVRRISMTLPSGQVVNYDYGTANAMNDKLSRVEAIKDSTTTITSYKYLGMGGFVGVDYTVPGVGLSYDGSGTKYSGLDAFNRVIDLRWKISSTNKVQAKYGYSRASNRTFRKDQQAHDDGKITQDQMFWYDGLYQVVNSQRGNLTPGSGPPYTGIDPATRQQTEIFGYDQMGNWLSYNTQSPSLIQTRAHNKANEITSISNASNTPIQPNYDLVGNMTQMPQPTSWTQKFTAKWDAWNRLIQLKDNTGNVLATYAYDGLFRRVTKVTSGATRKFYYTRSWQVAEEYIGSATAPQRRYFWGLRNLNDLIRRQRYSSGTTLQDDLYALADAMNVVALIEKVAGSPVVQQRIGYDAFGTPFWMDSAWVGSTNSKDWNISFHSHYLDTESGLFQMRYRYYHPTIGRWLSRDPIGERGGANLYAMAWNNIVNNIDWLGLVADCSLDSVRKLQEEMGKSYYGQSIEEDAEYGGMICCGPCQQLIATVAILKAHSGGMSNEAPHIAAPCPKGFSEVGWWHTHGGPRKRGPGPRNLREPTVPWDPEVDTEDLERINHPSDSDREYTNDLKRFNGPDFSGSLTNPSGVFIPF